MLVHLRILKFFKRLFRKIFRWFLQELIQDFFTNSSRDFLGNFPKDSIGNIRSKVSRNYFRGLSRKTNKNSRRDSCIINCSDSSGNWSRDSCRNSYRASCVPVFLCIFLLKFFQRFLQGLENFPWIQKISRNIYLPFQQKFNWKFFMRFFGFLQEY